MCFIKQEYHKMMPGSKGLVFQACRSTKCGGSRRYYGVKRNVLNKKGRNIFMKEMKQRVISSWKELKYVRTLAITAMLIALGRVLGYFAIPITQTQRIGLASLANEFIALLFGPVVGGLSAGVGDIVNYLMKPSGPFFPGFTISAFTAGAIYGLILYKRPFTFVRVLVANITVTVVVNMTLNNVWLSMMYGNRTFWGLFVSRAPLQIATVPVEVILFFLVVRMLKRAKVFAMLEQ